MYANSYSISSFLLPLPLILPLSSSFTDAIVVVEFTKRDIADYFSYGFWDKKKALVLTVGDVITDVKLVCL